MSRRREMVKPKSLAQHFESPDEFIGLFGWMCGYSADDGFLNDAIERFTRRTNAQRAFEGRIAIALMLDPSHEQVLLRDVPGVLHLPINQARPFNLLHAKVAILGFHHETDPKRWRIRLIVSTGNWTRATLEDSLDLAWCVDIANEDLRATDDSVAQSCANLTAAWEMMQWLMTLFKSDALTASHLQRHDSTTEQASNRVQQWLDKIRRHRRGATPQFFDTRTKSLLDQLPALIRHHCGETSRNYLAMGSGFYESPKDDGTVPVVLNKIVRRLQDVEQPLLTQKPEVDVFVNPKACQAIAGSLPSIRKLGWTVRCAGIPSYFVGTHRSLHAKFIFSFNYRNNSNLCNSAWLYLGSGNLTTPGFTSKMRPGTGNLEAGIVFAPDDLYWAERRGVPLDRVVTNVLPIQQDDEIDEASGLLQAGNEMPEPVDNFIAAPVVVLSWHFDGESGWLIVVDRSANHAPDREAIHDANAPCGTKTPYELLDDSHQPCLLDPEQGFRWSSVRPREVRVRWRAGDETHEAWVPVIDEYGRMAATMLPRMDLDQAWEQLDNFPMPPDDEDLPDDGGDVTRIDGSESGSYTTSSGVYPVRQMMQLIENIAAKQTSVSQTDWRTWCTRLEQCLIQSAESKVVEQFRELQLNPLSPLWHAPFRPDFAVSTSTPDGKRYEETLTRIEIA